jgi:hypothetical protein
MVGLGITKIKLQAVVVMLSWYAVGCTRMTRPS